MTACPKTPNQITLGKPIADLRYVAAEKPVAIDCSVGTPGRLHSYRGYYEDLSIHPLLAAAPCRVAELRTRLESAVGEVFEGYKGGIYRATGESLLWISAAGCSDGNAVTGVREDRDRVVILTEKSEA